MVLCISTQVGLSPHRICRASCRSAAEVMDDVVKVLRPGALALCTYWEAKSADWFGGDCIVLARHVKCPTVHAGLSTAICLSAVRRVSQGRALLAVTVTLGGVWCQHPVQWNARGAGTVKLLTVVIGHWTCKSACAPADKMCNGLGVRVHQVLQSCVLAPRCDQANCKICSHVFTSPRA
jgi:hypothetical protein